MTDTPPTGAPGPEPADALDELLSAYLDGEVTAEERARIEADPALRARADELAAARSVLAEPVEPLGADDWRSILAAAQAHVAGEADGSADGPAVAGAPPAAEGPPAAPTATAAGAGGGGAEVIDLAARRRPQRALAALAAVAAAAVLVVVLVASRTTSREPGGDIAGPTSAPTSSSASSGPASSTTHRTGMLGVTGGGTVVVDLTQEALDAASGVDLGALEDEPSARGAVEQALTPVDLPLASPAPTDEAVAEDVAACVGDVRAADPTVGRLLWWADASHQDTAAYVLVFEAFSLGRGHTPEQAVLATADEDGCTVVTDWEVGGS